jgi:arsenate reductase (thioredoxin)
MTTKKISFVCLHGSAKSLIAAEYLTRAAQQKGLGLFGTTCGPEPDDAVPSNVVDGLRGKGIDVEHTRPIRLSGDAIADAIHVVSFGPDLSKLLPANSQIENWSDCPAVSDDFEVAWQFITGRVDTLLAQLETQSKANVSA